MIVYWLVILLLGGLVAVRAVRPLLSVEVDRWLQAHGLDVGADSRAVVARHLQRSRRWRAAGLLPPYVAGTTATGIWVMLYSRDYPPEPWHTLGNPGTWIACYALGAVLAELTRPRPFPAAGDRAAALLPRQPRQYLPGWVLPACWAAAAGAVLVTLALRWLPLQDEPTGADRSGLLVAASAVDMAALLHVVIRVVLRRRQPYASTEQLAVDDALRSACLHRVAGAGMAFVLLVLAGAVWNLAVVVDLPPLRFLLPVIVMVGLLPAAWCAFVGLRAERWRVPRAPAGPSPETDPA